MKDKHTCQCQHCLHTPSRCPFDDASLASAFVPFRVGISEIEKSGLLSPRVFCFQGYPREQPLKVAFEDSLENKRPKLINNQGLKSILGLG